MEVVIGIIALAILIGVGLLVFFLIKSKQNEKDLSAKLKKAEQNKASLENQRNRVSKSNEKALWALYLSDVALQTSGILFHNERARSKDIGQKYRKTAEGYRVFNKKVEDKARQRLVKKGFGVVLSFIPGLGLLDLLSDMADILSDATDATDEIEFAFKALDENSSGSMVIDSPISSANGEIPIALTQEVQGAFKEAVEQNLGTGTETPDPSTFNTFAKDVIQRTEDLDSVKVMLENEHEEAIRKIFDSFKDFGVEYYEYHKSQNSLVEENAANSKNSENEE